MQNNSVHIRDKKASVGWLRLYIWLKEIELAIDPLSNELRT